MWSVEGLVEARMNVEGEMKIEGVWVMFLVSIQQYMTSPHSTSHTFTLHTLHATLSLAVYRSRCSLSPHRPEPLPIYIYICVCVCLYVWHLSVSYPIPKQVQPMFSLEMIMSPTPPHTNILPNTFTHTHFQVAIKKMKRKFYSWEECMALREVKVSCLKPL